MVSCDLAAKSLEGRGCQIDQMNKITIEQLCDMVSEELVESKLETWGFCEENMAWFSELAVKDISAALQQIYKLGVEAGKQGASS